MRTSLIALAIVVTIIGGFIGINYFQKYQEKQQEIGGPPPPIDSATINATILSFESEPIKPFSLTAFQVNAHINKIIAYRKANCRLLIEGEEISISLVVREVSEIEQMRVLTAEEYMDYLPSLLGKTTIIDLRDCSLLKGYIHRWYGNVTIQK